MAFMHMQIDTKDILFICGGAFVDLEKTISERYCSLTHCNLLSPPSLHLRFFGFSFKQKKTAGFIYWFRRPSSCKHEGWWHFKCSSDIILVGIC
jgi:hypothetical protein